MTAAFGSRTYLVGCAIQGLLANPETSDLSLEAAADMAIQLADMVDAKMSNTYVPKEPEKSCNNPPKL